MPAGEKDFAFAIIELYFCSPCSRQGLLYIFYPLLLLLLVVVVVVVVVVVFVTTFIQDIYNFIPETKRFSTVHTVQCCSCSVATICVTCTVISHDKRSVPLH
jgi:hypothetical protein